METEKLLHSTCERYVTLTQIVKDDTGELSSLLQKRMNSLPKEDAYAWAPMPEFWDTRTVWNPRKDRAEDFMGAQVI